jgi:hypothetical protein
MFTTIVIIILILAISLEMGLLSKKTNPIEHFIGMAEPSIDISKQFKDWDQTKITFLDNRPIAWVYIPLEINSKQWLDFMSRRNIQEITPINYLCLETIYKNLNRDFNIVFFNQGHIEKLLPDYKDKFILAKDQYFKTSLLKYSLLYKYGGIYIPNDTIFIKGIDSLLKPYNMGYSITLLENNLNYIDNKGVDETILMAKKEHQIIKKCLEYILSNITGFQNAFSYRDIMGKLYNEIISIDKRHKHLELGLSKNSNGKYIRESDLFSHNKLVYSSEIAAIPLRLEFIDNKVNYNYIKSLKREEILYGNMEISRLLRSGVGIERNIDTELGDSNFFAYGKLGVVSIS